MLAIGTVVLLGVIVGVPAMLVPMTMSGVPERSMNRVLGVHQEAANIVSRTFARHNAPASTGRLAPLPVDTRGWIELINPMGRRAPGGGHAILPRASEETGAIGLRGDQHAVTLTIPAYRDLEAREVTIHAAEPEKPLNLALRTAQSGVVHP